MIQILKPAEAPAVLRTRGESERKALSAKGRARVKGSDFKSTVYGHHDVKSALHRVQHGKCCYCEKKVDLRSSDVDHWRPKAGVQQAPGEPLESPGYYWLAYAWDNLLLSCIECNQRHKRSLFPLRDPARRARSPRAKLGREEPLLVHPANEDPRQFLRFHREIAYAVGDDARGRTTIAVLALNDRPALVEERREHLAVVQALEALVSLDADPDARAWLDGYRERSAKYASMISDHPR